VSAAVVQRGAKRAWPWVFLVVLAAALAAAAGPHPGFATSCDPATIGVIGCENQLPGSPPSQWDIGPNGADKTIEGFADKISVDHGGTIGFKVKTDATEYTIEIYRVGWYGGDGARRVAVVQPSAALPQTQPACLHDDSTGLVDCGNWALSASWDVPATAVSGLYLAILKRTDTGGTNEIPFVVRDDERHADMLFQTSDETWEAYNEWGGNSLYTGPGLAAGRAYKVSYNRPFTTRAYANPSYPHAQEIPMIRWLERNGYDVSYTSGIDVSTDPGQLAGHKAFLSTGHDEYWSGSQRANVEAARAQGLNLAFFSANEVFWKTRLEPSIDPSGAANRTLVAYKETKAGAKIDPSPEWTGTWRDPRLSPPSDGGRPENALTGTLFTVDAYREDAMKVPASYSGLRLWRNTDIARLAPGAVYTTPIGILGHEWDEDVDNGFRPAGLFDLSETSMTVDKHLIDYGNTYVVGPATHHLTMYRAASGALVFGSGTAQWSWGLDSYHDMFLGDPPQPPDPNLQQATVNLFADMGVQPQTLQANLVGATKSTDTTPPTSAMTSPTAGSTVSRGSTVTIHGTASDPGTGVVAGVEVSTDGGTTWHPAQGTTSWTYAWSPSGYGNVQIKTRAVDDSGNLESPGAGIAVSIGCPCTLWPDSTVPSTTASSDGGAVEVGVKFQTSTAGWISGIRFYKGAGNSGTHVGSLWSAGGSLLGRATFSNETANGWQTVSLPSPVHVSPNTTYVASYYAPNGHYALTAGGLSSAITATPLTVLSNGSAGGNGVYGYGSSPSFPSSSYGASNYWVDVLFETTQGSDSAAPTVTSVTPADGALAVSETAPVTATFSEAIDPASLSGSTFKLRDAGGSVVPASVSYSTATATATLQPSSPLTLGAVYTASVSGGSGGVTDLSGNPLASSKSWSFTVRTCPCGLWAASDAPELSASSDGGAVELGMKFRSSAAGWVTGVKFFKGTGNTGTHVGSLWNASGTLLARATFVNETANGWQSVSFDNPVHIAANTTYVASYYAPNGHYAVDTGGFGAAVTHSPLTGLASGTDGGNGVYRYAAAPTYPDQSYAKSNYWVDVLYTGIAPTDTTPPTVSGLSPDDGSTDAPASTTITATFSEPMAASSITGATFHVLDATGTLVSGSVAYDDAATRATFTPSSALTLGGVYTAVVQGGSGGVTDQAGNALAADKSWSFTVRGCPCSIWTSGTTPALASSSDGGAVELGVKFRSDVDGWVTGVKFYKGSGNTGTHVGNLWRADGTPLAQATFTNETASGWQTASFATPVQISANTTYVASYFAPNGHYSLDFNYFTSTAGAAPLHALGTGIDGGNGVYRYSGSSTFPFQTYGASNYWVDIAFTRTQP
jgi:hypothetical protein